MSFDGLAHFTLDRVQLHVPGHSVLLGGNANQEQPLTVLVRTIVDDLTTSETGVTIEHLLGL